MLRCVRKSSSMAPWAVRHYLFMTFNLDQPRDYLGFDPNRPVHVYFVAELRINLQRQFPKHMLVADV